MTKTLAVCCVPISSRRLKENEAEAAAAAFKALADPHRIQIVNMLYRSPSPVCVCDITADLDLSQPTVSFHLKKLVDAGLLDREQRGTWAYYSVNHGNLDRMSEMFKTGGKK